VGPSVSERSVEVKILGPTGTRTPTSLVLFQSKNEGNSAI
jgi:hypothetical protein